MFALERRGTAQFCWIIFKVFGYWIKTLSHVWLSLNIKAEVSSMHLILNFQRGGDGRGMKPIKPWVWVFSWTTQAWLLIMSLWLISGQQSSWTLTLSKTKVCKFIIVMSVWQERQLLYKHCSVKGWSIRITFILSKKECTSLLEPHSHHDVIIVTFKSS